MTAARIQDLNTFVGIPTGQEIMEVSNGGTGSFQITIGALTTAKQPTTISVGGITTVTATQYGDILVTTNAAVTVQLPASASRNGAPVSVVANQTTTPNITILPNGAEKIIGQTSLTIANAFGAYTLWPLASGGWYQK